MLGVRCGGDQGLQDYERVEVLGKEGVDLGAGGGRVGDEFVEGLQAVDEVDDLLLYVGSFLE